mgnify:CR=1 FL=1
MAPELVALSSGKRQVPVIRIYQLYDILQSVPHNVSAQTWNTKLETLVKLYFTEQSMMIGLKEIFSEKTVSLYKFFV